MKVGLIPPRGLEGLAQRSKFHLALAIPELLAYRPYGGMYLRLRKAGDFVVLDNGLAEGKPATPTDLMTHAAVMGASEVVLTDVMRDADATIKVVKAFFNGQEIPTQHRYMAVAQGTKSEDYFRCVEEFSKLSHVKTVGLPRHMLETLGIKAVRIDLAHWIEDHYPNRFDIHLMGANPVWLPEVRNASKYAPFIRSVDTSMPFSYAIEREDLALTTRQITRPAKYFDIDWSYRVDGSLLRSNIQTLLGWADATSASTRTQASASKMRGVPAA